LQIEGKVNTIIYRNEKNGYTVLLLKSDDEYITAVGETSGIDAGDFIEIEGELIFHKSYGEQFAFTKIAKVLPSDSDAVVKYISSGLVKGLGEKTAKKILDRFKEETINVIRYSPEKLLDVKGMTDEKAYALSEHINDEWERWNLASFLSKYSIGVNVSNKIFAELGLDAIKIINESPYALMEFVPSLEFKTVDTLAEGLSISKTHLDRVKAGIIYFLSYIMKQGHTCIELEALVLEVSLFLGINEEHIYIAIEALKNSKKVAIEEDESDVGQVEYIYRGSMYRAEKNIAKKILEMSSKNTHVKNIDKLIESVSEKESLVLSEEQKEAITIAISHRISIITGGPGTGKTTIIKCIIDIFKEQGTKYVLAAPTGRAARRITEMTRENASTIHRLLEITKVDDNNLDDIINYPVNKLNVDAIIIDEASMIDTVLMNNIVKAIDGNSKLVLVGDAYQLPAVGAGNVLKDIISSETVPTIYLNEIYRQSAKSDIIVNAHRVKDGEGISFKNKDTDLYFIETDTMEDTKAEVESLLKFRLEKTYGERLAKDVQVLTPIKKTELGIYGLNKMIQKIRIKPTKEMVCKKTRRQNILYK